MARKEINIFGTSFLDLLSGALAAVIILFIIVPKMTVEQQNTLEEIDRMEVQVAQISELMEQIQNTVAQNIYQEIERQLQELESTATRLRNEVEHLQERLAASENENQRLQQELQQRQNVEQQNEQLQQRIAQLEAQLQQQQESGSGISDGKVFGMNAELGIACLWPENVDVDLYVEDTATGNVCYYGEKNRPFGSLLEDVTSRTSPDDDRYELFYQKKITPGSYKIYINIYNGRSSRWDGTPAHVQGYVVMHPGKPNQKKLPYQNIVLTQPGHNYQVGILTVTTNNITLQQ